MKVAISSTGKTLESEVDARFGRCSYFLIVEIENKKIKSSRAIDNTAAAQGGGAGPTAAQIVGNEKVDAVISANFGPRAFDVLSQLGIEIYLGSGKIKDVLKQLIENKLQKIESPTGPMFMGQGQGTGTSKGQGAKSGKGRRE